MANVVSLAERTNDARFISVEQMLDLARKDYEDGELHGASAILLVLDRGPENDAYAVGFRSANLKKSEIVALLTVEATKLSRDLADG